MKWLEKNWVVVAVVGLGYLWFNGSLQNLFARSTTTTAQIPAPTIMGG